ncbi:hypothetical protein Catovirus_1_512 [Catovirus CTV1]|uniref:Uncharacterized protein n=1 Tax=Catovirus CTV1 TaxID=1977631 RepID=A0A1V0S9S6_9VIRU|nr:hypothetical protein Catovirus_1_512 [Catovirus CTV1]
MSQTLNQILKPHNNNKKNEDKDKENDKEINKEKGRIPKEVKYVKERKEVLNRLLTILGINDKNKTFFIHDLENDEVKKGQMLELVNDVKTYFSCSMWVYFAKKNVPNWCTSLAKSILKDMKVKITSVSIRDNETNRVDKKGIKIHL